MRSKVRTRFDSAEKERLGRQVMVVVGGWGRRKRWSVRESSAWKEGGGRKKIKKIKIGSAKDKAGKES